MDKNKKTISLNDFIKDNIKDINIINRINEYMSYINKTNINNFICDKRIEICIKNINNNNLEEIILDIFFNKLIEKYYEKFQNIFTKNDIAKLYLYISKYTKEYLLSLNMNDDLFDTILNNKFDDIEYNLKNPKCDLLKKLNDNIMKIEDLPNLNPSELDYNIWSKCVERKKLIDYKNNNITTTDLYKCKKCKENKCISWQMQTRSADEPMTIFVQCTICSYTFKMG